MEQNFTAIPTSEDLNHQQQNSGGGGGGFPEPRTHPAPMGSYYNQGQPIEMQPMIGQPYGYGPPSTGYGYQQPVSPLDNLGFLQPLTEIFLDDDSDELLLVSREGSFILKVDKQHLAARQQSGIGGAQTSFLTRSGQKMFACYREEFSAAVVAGEFALGDVEGDCCGCDRSFIINSKTGGPNFDVTPTGAMAGAGCSCCNSCCMVEYLITNTSTGNTVGTLTCAGGDRGPRHRITFEPQVDVKSKALILAAALVIYDLYFSPCCGHVGDMGSRYICACVFSGTGCLIFLILVIYVLLRGDPPEPKY